MTSEIKQRIEQINNGQVPEGYFRTTAGIIPQEWRISPLCSLLEFKNGVNADKEKYGSGIKMISVMDVLKNTPIHYNDIIGQVDIDENTLNTYCVNYGDILFQRSSETAEDAGKSNVYLGNEKTTYSGFVIRGKKKADYCPYFLNEALKKEEVRKQLIRNAAGSQHINIGQESLEKIEVCLPSATEQEKIAEILMKWDKAIELQEKYVEKLIIRKDKTIQELIKAQKNWIKTTLSTVLIEKSERTKINNQHQVLSSTKIGLVAQSDYFDKQVASEDNTGYKIVKKGEIVLSPQNLWLGNINYNDNFDIGIVSPSYKIFEINNSFDKVFISTLMKSPKMLHQYVLSSEQGASVVRRNLNMDSFYDIQICVPTLEKQRRISTIISVSQKLIEFENEKLDKMKQQRKALQQYLLNGIVRVEV